MIKLARRKLINYEENDDAQTEFYQVCVHVIECKHLAWPTMDSYVGVEVDDQKKSTRKKESTNCPYFDEVYTTSSIFLPKKALGSITMDIGTVYAQQDHQFFQEWALLLSPDDMFSDNKGYIKCTIAILGKGDVIKTPIHDVTTLEENKTNIINDGQVARYICRIYKAQDNFAQDLCKVNNTCGVLRNITQNKELHSKKYVELKFGNLTGTTSLKNDADGQVEWNEQVTFVGRFPPLFQNLFIGIKDGNSSKSSHPIAEHVLKMEKISCDKKEGFPPTFGPAYIHMYAKQEGKGCSFYIAKLLFSLETILWTSFHNIEAVRKNLIEIGPVMQPNEHKEDKLGDMLVFCSISNLAHLNKKFDSGKVQIELNLGLQTASTADVLKKKKNKSVKQRVEPKDICARMNGPNKPCLSINYSCSKGVMYRVHQYNNMARIAHFLEDKLLIITEKIEKKENIEAYKILEDLLDELADKCRKGFALMGAKPARDKTRTTLDWERLRLLRKELEFITCVAMELRKNLDQKSLADVNNVLEDIIRNIYRLMEEPQRPYPDVIISIIVNEKRISRIRFKMEEIMYSQDLETRGEDCGITRILFFKEMQYKGESRKACDYPLMMAAEMFLWAGFSWESSKAYLEGLPRGYKVDTEEAKSSHSDFTVTPVKELRYYEKRNYQLRAHIFQGRFVPGADTSGLCDAYIKIYIGNITLKTRVMYQTLNPVWNQMLLLQNIILYGTPQDTDFTPPTIVIEAMDKDSCGKEEFMGRGVAKPTVKLVSERLQKKEAEKSRFEWIELFNEGEYAGEVLSAFELIELMHEKENLSFSKDGTRKVDFYRIPSNIRPQLAKYSLKVLFWGLRSYGTDCLNLESNPVVTVEVGSVTVKSSSRDKGDGNFTSSLATAEVELPEDYNYCPPITIKVWEKRCFGRLILVGSHIINNVARIVKRDESESDLPSPIATEGARREPRESKDESPDEDTNDAEEPLLKTHRSRFSNLKLERFLPHYQENKNENYLFDDSQYFDWWSKYYESIALQELKAQEKCGGKKICFAQCEDFSLESGDQRQRISPKDKKIEEKENIPKDEQNKPNKKELLKPFIRKMFNALKITRFKGYTLTKRTPSENCKETDQCNNMPEEVKNVTSSFEMFYNELEKQPEFNDFEDWVDNFIILHGKKRKSESQEKRIVGKFKGSIEVRKKDVTRFEASNGPRGHSTEEAHDHASKTSATSPTVLATPLHIPTYKVLVRVYVVRAFSLPPKDLSGRSDPYVVVSVGKRISKGTDFKKQSKFGRRVSGDRTQYVQQDLNPIFGRCYEVEATLPRDNEITISVWDWDLGGHDDLIGRTEIDIENRFYTKHRATCGISSSYDTSGYNAWRDPEAPTTILRNLCKHYHLPAPIYQNNQINIGESCFYCDKNYISAKRTQEKETLALAVLKQWKKVATSEGKPGLTLVPEHIETRTLYHPKKGRMVQGKLEMWIDMFRLPKWVEDKKSEIRLLGPPVDISPRKAISYELRVIIWNTSSVELQDTDIFNQKSSDIYVRGWLYGPDVDGQTTDVHYRSLTGEGNFNWRFVFPFLYLQPEKSMVTPQHESVAGKAIKFIQSLIATTEGQETGQKIPCRLNLQIWDEDSFTADDIIGAVSLDLTNCPIGAKTAKACNPTILEDRGKKGDLFKIGRLKGWWPVVKAEVKDGKNGKKGSNNFILTGKIEAELQMLTEIEAQKKPVGKGREGPEALPEPKRPDTSTSWLRSPFHSFKYLIWGINKRHLIISVILVLMIIFFLLMFYSLPGYLIKRIVGV